MRNRFSPVSGQLPNRSRRHTVTKPRNRDSTHKSFRHPAVSAGRSGVRLATASRGTPISAAKEISLPARTYRLRA